MGTLPLWYQGKYESRLFGNEWVQYNSEVKRKCALSFIKTRNKYFRHFFRTAAAHTSRIKHWSILNTSYSCDPDVPFVAATAIFRLRSIATLPIFFVIILSTLLCVSYVQPEKIWLLHTLTNVLHYFIVIVLWKNTGEHITLLPNIQEADIW